MAIQVRLDLTPAEFDLTRRALDSYADILSARFSPESTATPADKRAARAEAIHVDSLTKKLNQ